MSRTEASARVRSLKIIVLSRGARAEARVVGRGVSTRTAVQILGGILLRAERREASSSRRPTWSSRCARRSRRRWRATAQSSYPAGCSSTCRVCFPRARSSSSTARRRASSRFAAALPSTGSTPTAPRTSRDFPTPMRRRRLTVDTDTLLATLASVGRAVSRDEARPVLTGILMRFGDGKLVMAATDSYRLSYKETPIDGNGARARGDRPGACARGGCAAWRPPAARSSSASRRTRCSSGSTARG